MFKYRSYSEMPQWIVDYMLSVTGEESIFDLTLSEINGYLNGLVSYYDQIMEDF